VDLATKRRVGLARRSYCLLLRLRNEGQPLVGEAPRQEGVRDVAAQVGVRHVAELLRHGQVFVGVRPPEAVLNVRLSCLVLEVLGLGRFERDHVNILAENRFNPLLEVLLEVLGLLLFFFTVWVFDNQIILLLDGWLLSVLWTVALELG